MGLMVRVPFYNVRRHWCFTKAQITHSTAFQLTSYTI